MSTFISHAFFSVRTGVAVTLLLAITYIAIHWSTFTGKRWSAADVEEAVGRHLDDPNWLPHELKDGGYVVKDSQGRCLPAPTTKQPND